MHTRLVSHVSAWSELNTVTTFDAGATRPVESMADKHVALHGRKSTPPSSLLIESLIEHLCRLLEKDPVNQKNLYKAICSKLHQLKLIDQTYSLEEFESLRGFYQKAFVHLVTVAKSTLSGDESNSLVKLQSPNIDLSSVLKDEYFLQWSRYSTDYVEIEFIAKGGFGRVYKVRHKLDGEEYAVKKICLKYQNLNSFLRTIQEVKMLAKLNHPNIVSYKAAWLEPFYRVQSSASVSSQDSEDKSLPTSKVNKKVSTIQSDESSSIVFKNSQSETKTEKSVEETCTCDKNKTENSNKVQFSTTETSQDLFSYLETASSSLKTSSGIEVASSSNGFWKHSKQESVKTQEEYSTSGGPHGDNRVCRFTVANEVNTSQWSTFPHEWAVLYIQMQLCLSTLRHWLDERNAALPDKTVNLKESLAIYQHIVQGVEYIHSQGIVHHDIKPSNIFVNGAVASQIQVGDFGLACFLQHSRDDVTLIDAHNHKQREIGTKLYAAPEQLDGQCDMKSDIFSLGIVLFELIHPFSTDMERSIVVGQLREGIIPEDIKIPPPLINLISTLLSVQPEDRPTAQELVNKLQEISKAVFEEQPRSETASENGDNIKLLLAEIQQKEQEIEELRQRVLALESRK